jgi:hypothetical protein
MVRPAVKTRTLFLAAALFLSGCYTGTHDVVPVPPPTDTSKCGAAGANLEKMQCRDSRGDPMWVNKAGEPFKKTCEIAQEEGRVSVAPTCVSAAKTCEEANSCPVN